jgi:hypothetical protein
MSGYVIVTICPLYEGSVRTSWYPVMEVLKTTSPNAVPRAPYASPRNARPSSSMRTAACATGAPGAGVGKFNVEREMRRGIWRTAFALSSKRPERLSGNVWLGAEGRVME